MAEEVRYIEHPEANISELINAVHSMQDQMYCLASEVTSVNAQVDTIEDAFSKFLEEFRRFVDQDIKDRRLQEALNDQVTLQQELDQKFSRHQIVRRYVTGILQATDVSLIKKETISDCTEELMISVPHYWLAPALIAIAAWINDDQNLAKKAIHEAITRDDEKTSLLFCLICRRASRNQAASTWLYRYLAIQDPMNIERKLVVVLDAFANGLFGSDTSGLFAKQLQSWIAEMEDTVGFRETQIERWEQAIRSRIPNNDYSREYPYLSKYSKKWNEIRNTLNNAALHSVMHSYLKGILETPTSENDSLKECLDELLNSLITNYDSSELPLQERKRLADLIVEYHGDENAAFKRFDAEKSSFDERSDLTQLLTNAAMNPELVHASVATQKLSLSVSRDWLIQAYENVTLLNRNNKINDIEFEFDGFSGTIIDGSNEDDLCKECEQYFNHIRDERIASVKQNILDYCLLGISIVALFFCIAGILPWYVGAIGFVLALIKFLIGKKAVENDIKQIIDSFAQTVYNAQNIVRALCAEVIDLRRSIILQEKNYQPLVDYMQDIAPEQFVKNNGSRSIEI